MGWYLNPKDESKEMFLEKNGTPITETAAMENIKKFPQQATVCLVDNYTFRAAAICYDPVEFQVFSNPNDDRPRIWYSVPRDVLVEADDSLRGLLYP